MNTYIVAIHRESTDWVMDVPEIPGVHTFARNGREAELMVRDAIATMLDVDPDSFALTWRFPNLDDFDAFLESIPFTPGEAYAELVVPAEFFDKFLASSAVEAATADEVAQFVREWRASLDIMADPKLREILTRDHTGDYGPVLPPSMPIHGTDVFAVLYEHRDEFLANLARIQAERRSRDANPNDGDP